MDYSYPIEEHWSASETIDVIHFFTKIETEYEKGIQSDELMDAYKRFKEIVPGKSEEKKICNEFAAKSGYSPYETMKKAKEAGPGKRIKMK